MKASALFGAGWEDDSLEVLWRDAGRAFCRLWRNDAESQTHAFISCIRPTGVKVIAFLVDHGPVKPAFGYRVEYRKRSVVLSGDTRPSENLVKFAKGADLLIHEVGARSKQDPIFSGPLDELLPNSRATRRQAKAILDHHTDPQEAGTVFGKVKPKLAVFSHYPGGAATLLPLVRQTYAGPVEFGEDGMTIELRETINIRRVPGTGRTTAFLIRRITACSSLDRIV